MNIRKWKMAALALGLLLVTQACDEWVRDGNNRYDRDYWDFYNPGHGRGYSDLSF